MIDQLVEELIAAPTRARAHRLLPGARPHPAMALLRRAELAYGCLPHRLLGQVRPPGTTAGTDLWHRPFRLVDRSGEGKGARRQDRAGGTARQRRQQPMPRRPAPAASTRGKPRRSARRSRQLAARPSCSMPAALLVVVLIARRRACGGRRRSEFGDGAGLAPTLSRPSPTGGRVECKRARSILPSPRGGGLGEGGAAPQRGTAANDRLYHPPPAAA